MVEIVIGLTALLAANGAPSDEVKELRNLVIDLQEEVAELE